MKVEAGIETGKASMLDYVTQSLQSSLVLIAGSDGMALGLRTVLLVCQ
jgi:hypothetical protein